MTKGAQERVKIQRHHSSTMVRGDVFQINLGHLINSLPYKKFIDSIYSQRRTLSQQEISYRVLSHWDLEGLIE